MTAISVRHLTKTYHLYESPLERLKEALDPLRRPRYNLFHALRDVSFDVKQGEVVGIIGRNGSGKSTLLKIIAGALSPTSGEVGVNGRLSALLELGSAFNPELTGRENVFFSGMLHGLSRDEMERRFDEIERFADIGEFIDQPVKSYSSGMFVRLAFAVSVCIDPEILIIDEALSVGDMAFQQKCLERLRSMKERGVTILLVTHDIMLTRTYCERVIYLRRGEVVTIGEPETVGEMYLADVKGELQKIHAETVKTGRGERVRFGSRDGEIIEVKAHDPASGVPVVTEGGVVEITLRGEVAPHVRHPRFYVQIRDFRGYPLYGTHSMPDEIRVTEGDVRRGVQAAVTIPLPLREGEYSVTAAINDAPGDGVQIILDKVVGAATITVTPRRGGGRFHGIVDLGGSWRRWG